MYLESASCVDEIVCYGVVPAIEFLDLAMDERENGNDERAAMLETEAKAKLYKVRDRLEVIGMAGRRNLRHTAEGDR